jgi:PAS domain S-box-containing protein
MKILVLAPQPFYQERGTPIAVRLLVETLCSFGHEVDLLVYPEGEQISIAGGRLFRCGRPPFVRRVPIGFSWQKVVCDVYMFFSLSRLLLRNRYDVIHAVEEAVFIALPFTIFGKRKLVYDMDSSMSQQLIDRWPRLRRVRRLLETFERNAVRRSDAVLAVCNDLAEKARHWTTHPHRVSVLPDVPVRTGPPSTLPVDWLRTVTGPDAVVALYVGNLEHYQGIDLMIEAVARADVPSLHLVVIGGTDEHRREYSARSTELGIAERVHFMGPRPFAQLSVYLAQADILLSPRKLGENTPMKVYSYMQAGKAILATAIRSHTQVLDSACALLVPAESEGFARGLHRLARDAELRNSLGKAAKERVEAEYSLPIYHRRLKSAYDLLARGASPTEASAQPLLEVAQTALPIARAPAPQAGFPREQDPRAARPPIDAAQTALLEYTRDAIIIWEMNGRGIVFWNSAAEQLYGYTAGEAQGRTTHELLKTKVVGGVRSLESYLSRFGVWVGELRHKDCNGKDVLVEGRLAVVSEIDGGWLVIEVNRDVRNETAADKQVRSTQYQAQLCLALEELFRFM